MVSAHSYPNNSSCEFRLVCTVHAPEASVAVNIMCIFCSTLLQNRRTYTGKQKISMGTNVSLPVKLLLRDINTELQRALRLCRATQTGNCQCLVPRNDCGIHWWLPRLICGLVSEVMQCYRERLNQPFHKRCNSFSVQMHQHFHEILENFGNSYFRHLSEPLITLTSHREQRPKQPSACWRPFKITFFNAEMLAVYLMYILKCLRLQNEVPEINNERSSTDGSYGSISKIWGLT